MHDNISESAKLSKLQHMVAQHCSLFMVADQDKVDALMVSIQEIGLQEPIGICRRGGGPRGGEAAEAGGQSRLHVGLK